MRYSAANLALGRNTPPTWDNMSPLQKALVEPPYDNHDNTPRPNIAGLIEAEEEGLAAGRLRSDPQRHRQFYEQSVDSGAA